MQGSMSISAGTASRSGPHHRNKHKHQALFRGLLLLLGTTAVVTLLSNRELQTGVSTKEEPIKVHLDIAPLNITEHVMSERMLRMLVEECAKGEDTVIWVDPEGSMVVQNEVDPQHCPILDIMLEAGTRGIGMCTDAMLYVLHIGARLVGKMEDPSLYEASCGPATARMLMETMHADFVSKQPGVLHMFLLNAEHMWAADAALHRQMDVFLCKTEFCKEFVQVHVDKQGYKGAVWLMGHTSSDPTVDLAPNVRQKNQLSVLHVKGKSGLKHTQQLLECWRQRPDLPSLTVVGRFSWSEARDSIRAPNINFYPKVTEANNSTQTDHISFSQIRTFQVENPIHVCASEREGFGHYINEARAASAFVISTDHPPMNELITPAYGYLIKPDSTTSYDEMALGSYTSINAFLNSSQLCAAADAVVAMPFQEVQAKGKLARQAYLHNHAVLLARLQDLQRFLERRAEAGHISSNPRAGLWRQQLRQRPLQTAP